MTEQDNKEFEGIETGESLVQFHRKVISGLNDKFESTHQYYSDAPLDARIVPLVERLNNRWTVSTASCGGHWVSFPGFQYPYVMFHVFHDPECWQRITKAAGELLNIKAEESLTLKIEDDYTLPRSEPYWSTWRVCPHIGTSVRHAGNAFPGGKPEFDAALERFIENLVKCMSVVMKKDLSCR